jgi:aspartyl-tRNA(Asn)/glutamyl-tRNA(Gln) amidotransferase subunit C
MITSEQVKHIAKLARLGITSDESEKYAAQLSDIFSYIELLNEIDTKSVEPTSQVTGLKNVMREDKKLRICEKSDLLACTELPVERDQIKVKSVITM